VVGDATTNGSESGTSFKQALYFKDIGFNLHDTMIYEKNSSAFPASRDSKRYTQIFEYMFVLSKGKIRDDIKLLCDKSNKWAGATNWGKATQYDKDGNLVSAKDIKPCPDFSLRNNIWKYSVGFNDKTGHPAVFPEQLALDHILSWSNEGDVVLDCFMGSGTTGKMALKASRRFIGIEKVDAYFDIAKERIDRENAQYKLF
jgi:site-specific DNA-methyltransferase (adenine-specific)